MSCPIYMCNPCFSRFHPSECKTIVTPSSLFFATPPQNYSRQLIISCVPFNKSDELPQSLRWVLPLLLQGTAGPFECCHLCWAPLRLLLRIASSALKNHAALKILSPLQFQGLVIWPDFLLPTHSFWWIHSFTGDFSVPHGNRLWKWGLQVAHW